MNRVFPTAWRGSAPGLDALVTLGLPERVDIVRSPVAERFFDFGELPLASRPLEIVGIPESVLVVGRKCSWMTAINVRPPGTPIGVGLTTGEVWLLPDEDAADPPGFLNSGVRELEACLVASAEFHASPLSLADARDAFPALVRQIRDADPAALRSARRPSLWQNSLQSLAIDLAVPMPDER